MSDKMREATKQIATEFFYWWHNQPGSNTLSGFDDFVETEKGRKLMAALDQQGEQEPVFVLDREMPSGATIFLCKRKVPLGTKLYTRAQPAIPEGMVLVRKDDAESAINMMRYACHPNRSPHADALEANMLAAAPEQPAGAA